MKIWQAWKSTHGGRQRHEKSYGRQKSNKSNGSMTLAVTERQVRQKVNQTWYRRRNGQKLSNLSLIKLVEVGAWW